MAIGIISDTHDDMERIKRAVTLFNEKGVSHVIHAGDLVSPFTFDFLVDLRAPLSAIFGNNDGDRVLLHTRAGGNIHTQPLSLKLEGREIVVVHEPLMVEALASSGRFDAVVYGHTHTPDIRKLNSTLIINPGKAARLHKGKSTMAILDTGKMEAEVIEL